MATLGCRHSVIDYTLLNFEEKRERRAFQEQGALGLILELEKREILRLEAVSVELEKLPRTKPNTHRGEKRKKLRTVAQKHTHWRILAQAKNTSLKLEFSPKQESLAQARDKRPQASTTEEFLPKRGSLAPARIPRPSERPKV
ncbi:hypothetical protein Lal_00042189 [Lupinus albus]|nr:hypothetical protein Lal_00042189 [Lupinus albus]